MLDIKKLRELCEKATPGPWEVGNHRGYRSIEPNIVSGADGYGGWYAEPEINDAQFIAAARTALPELLDEVERLRKAVEFWADHCERVEKQRDELIKALEMLEKIFADKDFIEEDESEDFLHFVWTLAHGALYNLKRELARRNEIPEART